MSTLFAKAKILGKMSRSGTTGMLRFLIDVDVATNRKRNLVVKGLTSSDHRNDTDIFTELVSTNFGCVPVIIKTRW